MFTYFRGDLSIRKYNNWYMYTKTINKKSVICLLIQLETSLLLPKTITMHRYVWKYSFWFTITAVSTLLLISFHSLVPTNSSQSLDSWLHNAPFKVCWGGGGHIILKPEGTYKQTVSRGWIHWLYKYFAGIEAEVCQGSNSFAWWVSQWSDIGRRHDCITNLYLCNRLSFHHHIPASTAFRVDVCKLSLSLNPHLHGRLYFCRLSLFITNW